MTKPQHPDLARVSAETSKITAAARTSCEDTRNHIESSREAIKRSFELLARPFTRPVD